MFSTVIGKTEQKDKTLRAFEARNGACLLNHPDGGWTPVFKVGSLFYYLEKHGGLKPGGFDSCAEHSRFHSCDVKPLPDGYTITLTGDGEF